MKQKLAWLIFLLFSLTNVVVAQESKHKMQFSVLSEDDMSFKDLKDSDIQIKGIEDVSLTLKSDNPLEIIMMIDVSASQEGTLPNEKKAAQSFINQLLKPEKDKVSIISFAGAVALEQDLTNDFVKANAQIEKIEFVPPSGYIGGGIMIGKPFPQKDQTLAGSTSIWDSTKQVLEIFSKVQNNNNARRAVILISDGFNTYGESKVKEVVEYSIKMQIPIFAIGIGDDFYGGVDKKSLKKITEETGGISVFPKKKLENITQILKVIEQSLRSNYELNFTFNAINSKSKLQEIEIEIINSALRKRKLQIIQPIGFIVP